MKVFKIAAILTGLMFAAGMAHAFDLEAGDPVKGKEALVAKCKVCHDGSKAKKVSPASKTKKQWGRYFSKDQKKLKRKHADWDSFGLSIDTLQNIHRYMNASALDSDKPQTCD